MVAEGELQRTVNTWLARVVGRSAQELIRAFEAAFRALWQRTYSALGDVTLTAVVDRVLDTAKDQYPVLASLETTPSGLRCEGLQTQAGIRHADVAAAIGFVLAELLTVLGILTAHILTPALQAVLASEDAAP